MSPPAPSSPKKPPPKKRHTKPCRYFQTGSCPHAAQEDCDFAHVFSDQPSLLVPKQCRYYLRGTCTNGIWCQYRHGEAVSEDIPLVQASHHVNSPSGRDTLQMRVGVVPTAVYTPSPSNGIYGVPTPWSSYGDGFHSPLELMPPPHLLPKPIVSPVASLDSVDCVSPASSPTSSVSDDGVLLSADDAACYPYSYFGAQPQVVGVPYPASPYSDDAYMSPFPGYSPRVPLTVMPAYGMASAYEIFSPKAPPSAGFYASPQMPHAPINRQKLANYRTKPCRYFKPGSVCPNGDACTFIHAEPAKSDEVPLSESAKLQHDLPSKPVSTKEENTRKGYFPISWRVIGGGVRLSGAQDPSVSDDESELSEDSFQGRSDPVSRVLEIEIPTSVPPSAVAFPSSESNADADESMTPTGQPFRQRASSIPSTPISTHVDMLRLFSAESPGGL
ncbi:hypothetical protein B0H11DRAFT_1141315 [Mycena galericulata]|nr:hypothetical protein B0H11DRAFT_1141315 [Mycena galericulata]